MVQVLFDVYNAAFENASHIETARILRDVVDKIEHGAIYGPCFDANGNNVGRFNILHRDSRSQRI